MEPAKVMVFDPKTARSFARLQLTQKALGVHLDCVDEEGEHIETLLSICPTGVWLHSHVECLPTEEGKVKILNPVGVTQPRLPLSQYWLAS